MEKRKLKILLLFILHSPMWFFFLSHACISLININILNYWQGSQDRRAFEMVKLLKSDSEWNW